MSNFKSIEDVYRRSEALKAELLSVSERYDRGRTLLDSLTNSLADYESGLELIKELINDESESFISTIENLLTLAVRRTFVDVDSPTVKIDVKFGARNSAIIYYLYKNDEGKVIKSDVRNSVGGGVKTVISFILQTFFISYMKLERVIIADEAFVAISDNYRPYFIQFLRELSDKHNFRFLFITHHKDIVEEADSVYEMVNGELKKVRG